jgi:hypothetical protein
VAGERYFRRPGEDPHPRVMTRVRGRQHECRFRQVEFGGDGLHLVIGQAGRVGDNRQRIAAKTLIGEDVDGHEIIVRHNGPL